MKYIGILLGLLLWPAACMAPPTYGPYPTGGGGLSSNEVYAIALSVGGPTNGISAATATNIVNNNNAATATTASNVVAGITNLILNQRNGLLPPQVPSSLFNDWNSGILLLTNGTLALEDTHLSEASIGSIGDKLGLYYSSYDTGSTGRIFAAYGTLLNGFTKHGVVLAPTAASWDGSLIGGATHYREGRTNYLYYFGGTNFGAFEAEPTHIGVAYSTDGTNFTKYASNPIMQTTDITEGNCITLYTWFTKKVGLTYYGFFNAKHSSGTATEKVHLATAANPLGPWTYYGEIYRHTNASVTSDFTVADLPGGGYIAAYWVITNGFALSQSAYSDDLITWRHVARLNNTALVGTRLFYDDGIVLSYCVDQTSVYYTRPKRSYMGDFSAGIISASIVSGDGSGLTGVGANSLVDFQAATSGDDLSLIADLPGTLEDPNYWTYNLSSLRWRTTGGIIAGSGFIGSAAGLSNAPSGLFPGIIISTNTGSTINAVGITNGNVTIPGTLGVTGATTMGTLVGTTISGNGSGLSNAVGIIAGDASVTIVTNANARSFTITAAGGAGSVTTNILYLVEGSGTGTTNTWRLIADGDAISMDFLETSGGSPSGYDFYNVFNSDGNFTWAGSIIATNAIVTLDEFHGDGSGISNLNAAYISGDLSVSNLTAVTLTADTFNGNGSGISNLNASSLSSGTVNRPVTNAAVKTGDLVVTNSMSVNTLYATNLIVITTNDLPQTQSFSYFEDFLGVQLPTANPGFGAFGFIKSIAGIGSDGYNGVPTTNAPGIQTLKVGTQTTGQAYMHNFGAGADNASYSLRGVWTNEWRIRLSGTNNVSGTNNYQFQCGFIDSVTSFTSVDGAYVYYSTNNPYVGIVTANNSTRTTNYSTFVPDTNTWFRARIVVTANATLTNAVLTINGANNVTNTSNIPTGGARNVGLQGGMLKTDGTDSRQWDVDFVYLGYSLETSR